MYIPCPCCGQSTDADTGSPMLGEPPAGVEWGWNLDTGPHTCPHCGAIFETGILGMELLVDEEIATIGTRLSSPCAADT